MTQIAISYARVLYELGISKEAIEESEEILSKCMELKEILSSPAIEKNRKHKVVHRVFPKEICNFMNVLCNNQSFALIDDIFISYHSYFNDRNGILEATLSYVTAPTGEQLEKIKSYLKKKFSKKQVNIQLVENLELLGGFKIDAQNIEIDRSVKGRLLELQENLVRR